MAARCLASLLPQQPYLPLEGDAMRRGGDGKTASPPLCCTDEIRKDDDDKQSIPVHCAKNARCENFASSHPRITAHSKLLDAVLDPEHHALNRHMLEVLEINLGAIPMAARYTEGAVGVEHKGVMHNVTLEVAVARADVAGQLEVR